MVRCQARRVRALAHLHSEIAVVIMFADTANQPITFDAVRPLVSPADECDVEHLCQRIEPGQRCSAGEMRTDWRMSGRVEPESMDLGTKSATGSISRPSWSMIFGARRLAVSLFMAGCGNGAGTLGFQVSRAGLANNAARVPAALQGRSPRIAPSFVVDPVVRI